MYKGQELDRARLEYNELYDAQVRARQFQLKGELFAEAIGEQSERLKAVSYTHLDVYKRQV